MCVILTAKASQAVTGSDITDMVLANQDGTGIAWCEDGRVRLKRWLVPEPEAVAAFWADLESRGLPRMLHARLATHGGVCKELVHPFRLSDGSVLAHNGIISGVQVRKGESDTSAFVRQVVEPLVKELGADWLKPSILRVLGQTIGNGNKFAILTPTGDFRLVNAHAGYWEPSGVWVSNRNWKGGGYYGGGHYFHDWDDWYRDVRGSRREVAVYKGPTVPDTGDIQPMRWTYSECDVCGDRTTLEWCPGYWDGAEYLCDRCARGLGVPGK